MPWCTVVTGQVFGVAGQNHYRPSGMMLRYCWPSGIWGSMHIEGGALAAYRRDIDTAPDPAAKRAEIEGMLKQLNNPFRTAEATGQDIIDPRETRPLLCRFAEDAQRVLKNQLGPSPNRYRP
jgi:acetyl-CoA carboxylase carboxyltransferase component